MELIPDIGSMNRLFDLSDLLESGDCADGSLDGLPIHVPLISLRCPQLLKPNLNLSKDALKQLLQLVYGGEISSNSPSILIELYQFLSLCDHGPKRFVLRHIFGDFIRNKDNFFKILQLTENHRLEYIIDQTLSNICYLSLSNEELDQVLEKETKFSPKTHTRIVRAHAENKMSVTLYTTCGNKEFLGDQLKSLYKTKSNHDYVLLIGEDKIKMKVHRFILSARNEYFRSVFRNDTIESKSKQLDLSNLPLSVQSAKKLLRFLYYGEKDRISITESLEILMVKDYFLLKDDDLIQQCNTTLRDDLSPSNCHDVLRIANKWDQQELAHRALEMFVRNYKVGVSKELDKKFISFVASISK